MAYTPTTPGSATVHSIFDPNGGTCYKDAGATTPCTVDGDAIASSKDGGGGIIATKIGARTATFKIIGGVNSMYLDNAAGNTNTAGAALKWATGNLDPGQSTIVWCYKPVRRSKLIDDVILDPGLSTGGSGVKVNQIVHDSGLIRTYSGTGSGFGGQLTPFVAPSHREMIYAVRTDPTGTKNDMFRLDHVDSSHNVLAIGLGRAITADATSTGWILGGRNAANNFSNAYYYLAVAFNGVMTDTEVRAEMANQQTYLEGVGIVFVDTGSAPLLIVNGDSNSMGTGLNGTTPDTLHDWGYLLQQGLISAGISGVRYRDFGAATRQETHLDVMVQSIIDAANATSGKVVIVYSAGENDMQVVNDSATYARYKTHFGHILAGAPNALIVWLGIPPRSDGVGGYNTNRAALRVTVLTAGNFHDLGIADYVDIQSDSGLGVDGADTNTTYYNGDGIHWKEAGCARIYNGTDVGGAIYGKTLLNTVIPLMQSDAIPPVVASTSVPAGGTTIVVNYTEADSPPIVPTTSVATDPTGFTVKINGVSAAVSKIRATGAKQHTLYLGVPVFQGNTVLLSYTPGNVTDSALPSANNLAAFSDLSVTNSSTQTGGGGGGGGSGGGGGVGGESGIG